MVNFAGDVCFAHLMSERYGTGIGLELEWNTKAPEVYPTPLDCGVILCEETLDDCHLQNIPRRMYYIE